MPSAELAVPARMSRVAVVVPGSRTREALVELARAGAVELAGALPPPEGEALEALRRLDSRVPAAHEAAPVLLDSPPDVASLERAEKRDLLAGEAELHRRTRLAVSHGSFAAWVGWAPSAALPRLGEALRPHGSAVVELARPSWVEPPTLLRTAPLERLFRPLVSVYGAARYRDVDPTLFTAVSFVLMFGMMFGDAGHGLVLAGLALWLRSRRTGRLAPYRHLWAIPFAAGLAAAVFGVLYGELFGPTKVLPTLWLDPIDDPEPLLLLGVAVGAVLLLVSYALGIANRWRESGPAVALFDQSGIAGLATFAGLLLLAAGFALHSLPAEIAGGVLGAGGFALLTTGFALRAGRGAAAVTQVGIESVDAVTRLVSNVISFTRLAAFGLMHAALGAIVFEAASALWGGAAGVVAAVLVFVLGNVLTFSLELLISGVQALRLEYYELYSRIFAGEGHAFAPWSLPVISLQEEP
jgi:V/A-type H+-transporting ATPase subunit I